MITKNNWCTSNLNDRFKNKNSKFEVYLNPQQFQKIDFNIACEEAAVEIYQKYKTLYLAFSGGMDSDYILGLFHRLNIPITPIIICYGNEKENQYAYKTCKELKITPMVIRPTTEEFIKTFYEEIYLKYNGVGIHSTQVYFAHRVIKNGTLITGNHIMGDGHEIINETEFANSNEYDYYIPDTIDFLMYSPEITYAIIENVKDNIGMEWNIFKSKLYNIEYRNKIKAEYSMVVNSVIQMLNSKRVIPHYHHVWTKKEMFKIFNENV